MSRVVLFKVSFAHSTIGSTRVGVVEHERRGSRTLLHTPPATFPVAYFWMCTSPSHQCYPLHRAERHPLFLPCLRRLTAVPRAIARSRALWFNETKQQYPTKSSWLIHHDVFEIIKNHDQIIMIMVKLSRFENVIDHDYFCWSPTLHRMATD